jgi:superfamily II DNA/RNA helicase
MAESVSRRASKGPKQRWTASQKKARTSAPRPASGFNRTSDRRDVSGRSDSRPVNGRTDRTFADRNDRGPSGDRQDRPRYGDRSGAPRSDDRPDRPRYGDRPTTGRTDDRPRYEGRSSYPRTAGGQERGRYGDRPSTGRTDDRQDRPRYEGRSDSRPDSRADAGRSRELPNSRWEAGRDSGRPNWSDEGARRDQIGSSGRWADARDSRGAQPRGRDDDRPQTGTPPWRGSERNDRPAEHGGDRYRSDDRSSTSNDRPRYGNDRPSYNNDRPSISNDRPRYGSDRPSNDRPSTSNDRPRYGTDRPSSDRPRSTDDRPRYRSDDTRRDRPQRPDRPWEDRRPGMDRPRASAERGRPADRHRTEEPSSDQMEWTAPEVKAVAATSTGFADLGVPSELTAVLAGLGITEPFPIQTATIPDALEGRDVLGRGRTGSGKTLGFGLPMLTRLSTKRGMGVRGLVLVPTRELAMQVADVLAPLARATGLDVTLVAGGMPYGPQLRAFERGVDVVVATPGRLVDLLDQGAASLASVEVTVIDEADHMADLGFWPAVTRIVDETPAEGQRLLFSATLDGAVDKLVKRYMHDPVHHEVDPAQSSISTMRHEFWLVAPHHKNDLSTRVASRGGRTLVFARTQQGADRIAARLRESGVLAGALHGGLTQGARARVLAAFKDGRLPVLVATDVAARGIHVDDVSLVLQIDPPANGKDYLHRSGRTARAGEDGVVVSLLLRHQRRQVAMLAQAAGVHAEFVEVTPDDPRVTEIVGADVAGQPISEEEYAALVAPPVLRRRPRTGPRSPRQGGWQRRS